MVVTMDALVVGNTSLLRDSVVMTLIVLVRGLFDIDLVMNRLLSPLTWLVVGELMLNSTVVSLVIKAGLMTVLSAIIVLDVQMLDWGLGCLKGAMHGVFSVFDGLDIVLVVVLMVEDAVLLVLSVPLGIEAKTRKLML